MYKIGRPQLYPPLSSSTRSGDFRSSATMARTLSQTLTLTLARLRNPSIHHSPSQLIAFRCRSNRAESGLLTEVDLQSSDPDLEVMGLRLEEAIDRIHVKRATPDWLPFVPGSSFWVPPRRRLIGLGDLVGKLVNVMSEDEAMSLTTARGWPSTSYFVNGSSSHPEVEISPNNASQSEDEEG